MKKLLLLLFLPFMATAQTSNGKEYPFNFGIKNNASTIPSSAVYVVTQGVDGTQGKISPLNLPVPTKVQDSLNNVVHKTGNEVIEGNKEFRNRITQRGVDSDNSVTLEGSSLKFENVSPAGSITVKPIDTAEEDYVQNLPLKNGTFAMTSDLDSPALPMAQKLQKFIFTGDSLTFGLTPPNTISYPNALALRPPLIGSGTSINAGSSGSGIVGLSSTYTTNVYPHRPTTSTSPRSVLFVWIGANDYQNISTYPAVTYIELLEAYWQQAKVDGFTVVAFTIMPRTGDTNSLTPFELNRRAINTFIRNSTTPDMIVDTALLFPNPSDATFFLNDGSHLNDTGNKKLAEHVSACLMSQGSIYKSTTTEPSLYPDHSSAIGGILDKAAVVFGSSLTGLGTISPSVPNIGSSWTFSAWVKFPNVVSGGNINVIAHSGGSGFGIKEAGFVNTGGRVFVETATGSSNLPGLLPEYWYHISATKTGTTVSYYVNGNPFGTGTDSSSGSVLSRIGLGGRECSIARVRVFNYAKTNAQIITDYQKLNVFNSSDTGCIFAMADASTSINNVIKDLSNSASDITFSGSTYVSEQLPLYSTTTSGIGKYGTGAFGGAEFGDNTNFGSTSTFAFLSQTSGDRWMNAKTGKANFFAVNGTIIGRVTSAGYQGVIGGTTPAVGTFTSIIKSGGTATQFLKADGNVDNNTYAITSTITFKGTYSTTATAQTTFTVSIGQTMDNTDYTAVPVAKNMLSAVNFWVSNKTTTTFDIVIATGLTGAVAYDFTVTP